MYIIRNSIPYPNPNFQKIIDLKTNKNPTHTHNRNTPWHKHIPKKNKTKPRKIWLCSNASCELSMESAAFTRTWRLKRSASGWGFLDGDELVWWVAHTEGLREGTCVPFRWVEMGAVFNKEMWLEKESWAWKVFKTLRSCVIVLEVFLKKRQDILKQHALRHILWSLLFSKFGFKEVGSGPTYHRVTLVERRQKGEYSKWYVTVSFPSWFAGKCVF